MDKMRKPPLGAPPRYIVDGIRSEELERAMLRCIAAGYPIRVEWVTEYNEIRERLGYKDDLHD